MPSADCVKGRGFANVKNQRRISAAKLVSGLRRRRKWKKVN
jgi:hypothetical protein